MSGICKERVVIVTGAGRGIGRAHALAFASEGARIVVNDLGGATDGEGNSQSPADETVEAIHDLGGEAVANYDDITELSGAENLIQTAIDTWGRLDTLVNNAGILRDRMFVNTSEEEWDAVIRVHLRGHYCPAKCAAQYWRKAAKSGENVDARIINTSSASGLYGNIGQSNYAAAKAGIAALTLVQAAELHRYGITANAIAPAARTRMTEGLFGDMMKKPEEGFDAMEPENISPLVVWLGSSESSEITGQVFEVSGGKININEGWRQGPGVDKGARWTPGELGPVVHKLVEDAAPPVPVFGT